MVAHITIEEVMSVVRAFAVAALPVGAAVFLAGLGVGWILRAGRDQSARG